MNTNSEVKNTRDHRESVGARRLRRLTVRMVLGVRESQSWWTLKRPEVRAPFATHDSTSDLKMNTRGRTAVCALCITHKSRAGIHESQRDSVPKPRVGEPRLPWERRPTEISTPTGLWPARADSCRNPVGVEIVFTPISLVPACAARVAAGRTLHPCHYP